MLLVMVTSVALARSSLDTDSLFSLDIMFPKLTGLKPKSITSQVNSFQKKKDAAADPSP